jgi:hypothetical protein
MTRWAVGAPISSLRMHVTSKITISRVTIQSVPTSVFNFRCLLRKHLNRVAIPLASVSATYLSRVPLRSEPDLTFRNLNYRNSMRRSNH